MPSNKWIPVQEFNLTISVHFCTYQQDFFLNHYTSCRHQKHGKKRVNIDCKSLIIHCCIQYLQDTFRFVLKTAKYHYKKEKKSRYSRKHLIAIMMFVTKRKGLFRSTKANLRVEILRKIIWVYIDQS